MAEGAVFDAQAVTDAVAEGIAKIENASTMEELKAIQTQYRSGIRDDAGQQGHRRVAEGPEERRR